MILTRTETSTSKSTLMRPDESGQRRVVVCAAPAGTRDGGKLTGVQLSMTLHFSCWKM